MTTTLLVDSDIVAFKFASAGQETFKWGNGEQSIHTEDLEDVFRSTDDYLEDLQSRLNADEMIICLSCPSALCFRKEVLQTYKGNRKEDTRPVHLQAVKDYMAEKYKSYRRDRLEADDIMGILSTHPTLIPGKKVIVSEDKDMKTIPGWLYNPRKHVKPVMVTQEDADYYHLYQTLIGDATDHYAGCPGIGDKTAEEYLKAALKVVPYEHEFKRGPRKGQTETRYRRESAHSMWDTVVSLFHKQGLTEEDALVQARVARILRASDYDFKNKEVILWTPQSKTATTA